MEREHIDRSGDASSEVTPQLRAEPGQSDSQLSTIKSQLGSEAAVDWESRREEQRKFEWDMSLRLTRLASRLMKQYHHDPSATASLKSIAYIVELAVRMGRLSSGLSLDGEDATKQRGTGFAERWDAEFEAALEKAYGSSNDPQPASAANESVSQSASESVSQLPSQTVNQLPSEPVPLAATDAPATDSSAAVDPLTFNS